MKEYVLFSQIEVESSLKRNKDKYFFLTKTIF